MSSQGHATNYSGATGTFVNPGYQFSTDAIRDSSDWTKFRRYRLISREEPGPGRYPSDPWQVLSGDRRLDYMTAKFQLGATGLAGCTGCHGNAYSGDGNPYTN